MRMFSTLLAQALVLPLAITAAAGSVSKRNPTSSDANVQAYVSGTNAFGLKVFRNLSKAGKENILYSPVSMNSALSIVGHFAEPRYQEQMIKAMGVSGLTIADYNAAATAVNASFRAMSSPEYTVTSSTSFWVDKSFPVEAGSVKVQQAKSIYDSGVDDTNLFAAPKTAAAMNAWVKTATKGRISQLVSPNEIAPLHWAAINAVYFEGKWFEKFASSYVGPFAKPDGSKGKVQYLSAQPGDGVDYIERPDMNLYKLSYGRAATKMLPASEKGTLLIVQPKDPSKLGAMVQAMTGSDLDQIRQAFANQQKLGKRAYVEVSVPSFELAFDTDMNPVADTLKADGAADFFRGFDMTALNAGFTASNDNKIRLIKQRANITLANEGTVAAAATFVGGGIESMGPRTVAINSAFAYFIFDEDTGAMVFAGTLTNPDVVTTPK